MVAKKKDIHNNKSRVTLVPTVTDYQRQLLLDAKSAVQNPPVSGAARLTMVCRPIEIRICSASRVVE